MQENKEETYAPAFCKADGEKRGGKDVNGKKQFSESANGIQKTTKELLERLTPRRAPVGELLVSVRHSESELLEKEEQKRKAREERESAWSACAICSLDFRLWRSVLRNVQVKAT